MGGEQSTPEGSRRRTSRSPPANARNPQPTPYNLSSSSNPEETLRNVTDKFFEEPARGNDSTDQKTVLITEEQFKEFEALKSQIEGLVKEIKVPPKPADVIPHPPQHNVPTIPPPVHAYPYVQQNHPGVYGYVPHPTGAQVHNVAFVGPNLGQYNNIGLMSPIPSSSIFSHPPPPPLIPTPVTPSGLNQAAPVTNYHGYNPSMNKPDKNVDDLIAFLESPIIEESKSTLKPAVPAVERSRPVESTGAIPRTNRNTTPQHIFTSEVIKPKAFHNNGNRSKSIPRTPRNKDGEQSSESSKPAVPYYNRGRGRGYYRGGGGYHGSQDNLAQSESKGYYQNRGRGGGYVRENMNEKSFEKEERRQYYQNQNRGKGRGCNRGGNKKFGSKDNLDDGNKTTEKGGDSSQDTKSGLPNRGKGRGGKARGAMTSHGSRGDLENMAKMSEKEQFFVELKPEEGKKGKELEEEKDEKKINKNENVSVDEKNKKDYKKEVIEINTSKNPIIQQGAKDFISSLGKPNIANNLSDTTENKDVKTLTSFEKNEIPNKVKSPSEENKTKNKARKAKKNINKEPQAPAQHPEVAKQPEVNPDEVAANTLAKIREATASGEYTEKQLQEFISECKEYFETQVSKVMNIQPEEKVTKSEEEKKEKLPEIPTNILRNLLPSHWALVKYPILNTHIPVELHPESPEYMQLYTLFHRSVKEQMNIEKIARIENAYLWFMYLLKKEELTKHFGYEPEEKILFHGTDNYNLNSIFENNFNWRKLNKPRHKYGQGVTFSPLASNASFHSRGHPKSHRNLIVSRVLICHEKIGTEETVVPPFGFDTTKRPDGKIIVKFDDYTFYPEHVITFSGAMLRTEDFNSPFKKVNNPAPK